ncbi:hypothetical protein BGL_1c23430 [Burkholderia plantarii]|uniref:Uncharacterized protein n=1 Tax=Burkholderia plantarii TaxID=41899 RepID=A0A0B6RNI5_BURPL|nr:hypothetical protein BGL_1c23430 [Burkholderia plantarii]
MGRPKSRLECVGHQAGADAKTAERHGREPRLLDEAVGGDAGSVMQHDG